MTSVLIGAGSGHLAACGWPCFNSASTSHQVWAMNVCGVTVWCFSPDQRSFSRHCTCVWSRLNQRLEHEWVRIVVRQGSLRTQSIGPAIRRVEASDPTGLVSVLRFSWRSILRSRKCWSFWLIGVYAILMMRLANTHHAPYEPSLFSTCDPHVTALFYA